MPAREWSPVPPPPVEEHPQLRLFLDRASAVVAQCGGLNAKSRLLLGKLAEELGISREEAEPAIHTLLIATEDFSPGKTTGRERGPPALRKPPPLPRNENGARLELGEPPPVVLIDDETVLQNFLDQASYVLAQHGGWSAKTRVVVTQLAQSMGITSGEMELALAALVDPGPNGVIDERASPPLLPMGEDIFSAPPESAALPMPDEPPAPPPAEAPLRSAAPPRSQPAPQEVYCAYLHKAMDDLRRPRINPRREQRLIEQGVHKLGLAPHFARRLLCDVARERQVTVESQGSDAAAPEPSDERLAAFITRARAIIAEQRGVTAPGQVKLTAAAQELGLSDEERQRAMAQLQEGASPRTQSEVRRQELLAGYRHWLKQTITALPRRIITPDVVDQLVATGCDYHGVAADDAEAAVRESASEAGVRFVSQQRAVEHLARRVSEKMAGASVLYPSDRQRILVEGSQWGLSPQDMEAIITDQVEINRHALAAKRKRAGLAVAAIGAAGFVLACVVLASTLLRDRDSAPEIATAPDEAPAGGAISETSRHARPPDAWWDVDLSVAMTRAEVELPYLRTALGNVRSYSPNLRGESYRQLVAGSPRTQDRRIARTVLKEIVSGAYALDPSDSAAATLRERLLELLPDAKSETPQDPAVMEQAYAAVEMATAAATREGISDTRAEEMRRGLGRALVFTPDPDWDADGLRRESAAALTRVYYRMATAAAPSHATAMLPMYDFLSTAADRHLDPVAFARLDAQYLKAILAADESVWRQYQSSMVRVATSEDSTVVLQGVELLEACRDERLRDYLAAGLLRRIGLAPQVQTPEEVAAAVRQEFGAAATPARTVESAWRRFAREAEEQLSRPASDAAPLRLMEETTRLTRLSAMGCALSKGELGRAAYEQLQEMDPISLERRSSDDSTSSAAESPGPRARMVSRHIDSLSRASHPVQRIGYLKAIAENTLEIREIEPKEGEIIAKYLLAPKGEEEREAIAGLIPRVGKWKMVRLAAADLIVDTPLRQDLVEDVAARLVGEEPGEPSDDWRQRTRRKLMRSVVSGGYAVSGTNPMDAARETMLTLYQTQARAEGVAPSAYSGAASPTAVLPPMIEQLASRLAPKARSADDREFLTRIPHELTAAEYLGDNDLRRLALLERIWLRLAAIEVSLSRPDRAAEAQALVDQLSESDRTAPDVYQQLRNGQAALLRLALLRAP
jgi:hypothetical protein